VQYKQGDALTRRNRTSPPCCVGRPTAHAPGGRPALTPATLQTTDDDDRRPRAKQYWPISLASNNCCIVLYTVLAKQFLANIRLDDFQLLGGQMTAYRACCRDDTFLCLGLRWLGCATYSKICVIWHVSEHYIDGVMTSVALSNHHHHSERLNVSQFSTNAFLSPWSVGLNIRKHTSAELLYSNNYTCILYHVQCVITIDYHRCRTFLVCLLHYQYCKTDNAPHDCVSFSAWFFWNLLLRDWSVIYVFVQWHFN